MSIVNEYEVELCYKMLVHAYGSTDVDLKPSQVKKLLRLFFNDNVIEETVSYIVACSRPSDSIDRALKMRDKEIYKMINEIMDKIEVDDGKDKDYAWRWLKLRTILSTNI